MAINQRYRLNKIIKNSFILVLIGLLYTLFIKLFNFGIPCIINTLTGYKCPGCGITRSIMALLNGDVKLALQENAVVLPLLILSTPFILNRTIKYVLDDYTTFSYLEIIYLSFLLLVIIAFGIFRNLGGF